MRFTRDELLAFHGATVPDLLGPQTRLLFVGINPGLWTAAVQAHFSKRGNRFYPALHRAGITEHEIDASSGFSDADRTYLLDRGIGITNLVAVATARADELSAEQLVEGGRLLVDKVERVQPAVVAMLGITAYRSAFARPKTTVGEQPEGIGGARLWVVPNPSGLNAHSSLDDLAAAYREVAVVAGIVSQPRRPDTSRTPRPCAPPP